MNVKLIQTFLGETWFYPPEHRDTSIWLCNHTRILNSYMKYFPNKDLKLSSGGATLSSPAKAACHHLALLWYTPGMLLLQLEASRRDVRALYKVSWVSLVTFLGYKTLMCCSHFRMATRYFPPPFMQRQGTSSHPSPEEGDLVIQLSKPISKGVLAHKIPLAPAAPSSSAQLSNFRSSESTTDSAWH